MEDVDAFVAAREPGWDRLRDLASRRVTRRTPAEVDELVERYLQASTDLSLVRTWYRDPVLTDRLTLLVARAGGVIYAKRSKPVDGLRTFFQISFPTALWRLRWMILISAALVFVPAIGMGAWLAISDQAVTTMGTKEFQDAYVGSLFTEYYSENPAEIFAAQVTTNNIQVALMTFALGLLLCVPAAALLVFNGLNLGFAGGLFAAQGKFGTFASFIIPHGLLELSAIVVAGGAGLHLGWTIIAPGDRTRTDALSAETRMAVHAVIGAATMLIVSGFVEGFITGRGFGAPARITVGLLVEAAFGTYAVRTALAVGRGARGVPGP